MRFIIVDQSDFIIEICKNMDIKVSIIIPVYNVAAYLDTCLMSCINQTFRDIEIIVVNDGSRDESSQLIAAYAAMDNRIKIITKENQGLIYARKSGLDVARGEYVFHLDGDDYLEINAIEELYNGVLKSGADYVIGNYYVNCGNDKYEVRNDNSMNGLSGQDLLLNMLCKGWKRIWGVLIRKSMFDNLIYYPVFMGEDLFFNMQIVLKVKNAIVVDMCLYNYVNRSSSVTNQKQQEMSWIHNMTMVKAIFYLLDFYPYNQQIRNRVYLMFFPFYLHCISRKRADVTNILYDCYWSKKEVMNFLWRKRKDFYLIVSTFFRYPFLCYLMANIYFQTQSLKCNCGKIIFQCKNRCKF